MTHVAAHGLAVDTLPGWEARIFRHQAADPRESTRPIVHMANFALPRERGDFGGGVTDRMGPGDVFVTLFEYGPESTGKPLFAHQGRPKLNARRFSPAALQRTLPGQSGCQLFFTEAGRPFCLYVVIGSHARVPALVDQVERALARVNVGRMDRR